MPMIVISFFRIKIKIETISEKFMGIEHKHWAAARRRENTSEINRKIIIFLEKRKNIEKKNANFLEKLSTSVRVRTGFQNLFEYLNDIFAFRNRIYDSLISNVSFNSNPKL